MWIYSKRYTSIIEYMEDFSENELRQIDDMLNSVATAIIKAPQEIVLKPVPHQCAEHARRDAWTGNTTAGRAVLH